LEKLRGSASQWQSEATELEKQLAATRVEADRRIAFATEKCAHDVAALKMATEAMQQGRSRQYYEDALSQSMHSNAVEVRNLSGSLQHAMAETQELRQQLDEEMQAHSRCQAALEHTESLNEQFREESVQLAAKHRLSIEELTKKRGEDVQAENQERTSRVNALVAEHAEQMRAAKSEAAQRIAGMETMMKKSSAEWRRTEAQLDSQLRTQQGELESIQSELESKNVEAEVSKKKAERLEGEKRKSEIKESRTAAELKDRRAEIQDLKRHLESQRASQESQAGAMQSMFDTELEGHEYQIDFLNKEMARLTQVEVELATCRQELELSMVDCDEASRACDKAEEDAASEVARSRAAEKNVQMARKKAIIAYEEATNLGKERDAWIEEYTVLQNELNKARTEKEEAQWEALEMKAALTAALNNVNYMQDQRDSLKSNQQLLVVQANELTTELDNSQQARRRLEKARAFTQEEAENLSSEVSQLKQENKAQQAAYLALQGEKAASEKRLSSELAAAKYQLQMIDHQELSIMSRCTGTPKLASAVDTLALARPDSLPQKMIYPDVLQSKAWETGSIYTDRLAIGTDIAEIAAVKWRTKMQDAQNLCRVVNQEMAYGVSKK